MTTRTKHAKIEKELIKVQDQVIEKRKALGEAVLNDGDGSNAKITRLETALSKLQDREQGLQAAFEASQVEVDEGQDQATRADFKKDEAEVRQTSKLLRTAAIAYIQDFYKKRDDLAKLLDMRNRAKLLSKKHDDAFDTIDITKTGQVISGAYRTIRPLSRSIEVFAGDLVEAAGEKRRF